MPGGRCRKSMRLRFAPHARSPASPVGFQPVRLLQAGSLAAALSNSGLLSPLSRLPRLASDASTAAAIGVAADLNALWLFVGRPPTSVVARDRTFLTSVKPATSASA